MNFKNWAQEELKKVRENTDTQEDSVNPELVKLFLTLP